MDKEIIIFFDFDGVVTDSFDKTLRLQQRRMPTLTEKKYRAVWDGNINDVSYQEEVVEDFDFEEELAKVYLDVPIRKNAKEVLEKLSLISTLYIVSSNSTSNLDSYLKKYDLGKYFKEILSRDVETCKTKKIRSVLDKIEIDMNNVYFVTDTSGDIIEARKAGIEKVIAITGGFQTKERLEYEKPYHIIDGLLGLEEILRG